MPFEPSIRDAEIIERWGIVRHHRRDNVGAHSHRVAIYADQIADIIEWRTEAEDRLDLIRCALWHDMPEVITGDLQGPVKKAVVDLAKLGEYEARNMERRFLHSVIPAPSPEMRDIIKIADLLDEVLWCTIEMRMGNQMLRDVLNGSSTTMSNYVYSCSWMSDTQRSTLINHLFNAMSTHQSHRYPGRRV